VLDLLTCAEPGRIRAIEDPEANLAVRMGLRTREEIDARPAGEHLSSYAVIGD
jgi:hypothetical protein